MKIISAILLFVLISNAWAQPLTLNIPTLPLADAIRLLADAANMRVIVSTQVEGVVELQTKNANPAGLLTDLLLTHDLVKMLDGDVWVIAPRAVMLKQLQVQTQWQTTAEAVAKLTARSWKINYAKAADIAALTKEGDALVSERGQIWSDVRSNTVLAVDTRERLQILDQVIKRLDSPVRQVMIEARLVSIDQDAERLLGIDFDVKQTERLPSKGRYSVAIAHLPDGSMLDIRLAALEREGRAELISSPSLFTGSNQEASIEAGEEVPYQEVSESGGTAIAFKKAVLGLKVTPQILPASKVLLALKINQDRPGARMVQGMPAISTRQIMTHVQVKSGQTLVLGGIYELDTEQDKESLPILGNIPLLGLLFTQTGKRQHKRELLIFVTPKVMPQVV